MQRIFLTFVRGNLGSIPRHSSLAAASAAAVRASAVSNAILAASRRQLLTSSPQLPTPRVGTAVVGWNRAETVRVFSRSIVATEDNFPSPRYHEETSRALDTIAERLEADDIDMSFDVEVTHTGDVLTIKIKNKGTWVINKHNVTKQLWFSSPVSGPSRFAYQPPEGYQTPSDAGGVWVDEKNESRRLSDVLSGEMSQIFGINIEFSEKF